MIRKPRRVAAALAGISLGFVLTTALPALAQAPGEGWERVFEEDGIEVHRRFARGQDVVETFTVAMIAAPPRRVFAVLTDHANYPQFMPHFVQSRIIAQENGVQWIFQRLRISELLRFLIKDRYHVVRNRLIRPARNGEPYRIEWSLDAARTQEMKVEDAVATRLNNGYWELHPASGGAATRVHYYLQADPGGSIPTSFANQGTVESIPAVIKAVRDRAQSATAGD